MRNRKIWLLIQFKMTKMAVSHSRWIQLFYAVNYFSELFSLFFTYYLLTYTRACVCLIVSVNFNTTKRMFQTAVLSSANQRGYGVKTQTTGAAKKVRMRDAAVFRHSRVQWLLCRPRGLEGCDENRTDA